MGRLRHDYTGKTPLSGYAFVLPPRASGYAFWTHALDNRQECTKEALPMDVCLPPDEPPPSVASELVASKEPESGLQGYYSRWREEDYSWWREEDYKDSRNYEGDEPWRCQYWWKWSWGGKMC